MIDKPGPELDAKIAKAFGHEVIGGIGGYYWLDEPFKPLPQYSTTWSGMQLVVEEMQRRGWDYLASSLANGNHAMRFDKYSIINGQEVEKTARSDAPTLPHAVSMAALKALEDSQSC